jgi:hypothetical protein
MKTRLRLDDLGIKVRFPAGAIYLSLFHSVHTDSGVHPDPCSVGIGGFIGGVKRLRHEADN